MKERIRERIRKRQKVRKRYMSIEKEFEEKRLPKKEKDRK